MPAIILRLRQISRNDICHGSHPIGDFDLESQMPAQIMNRNALPLYISRNIRS